MEQPNFALIPSGIASGEVFSVLPDSGVGDFTFSRNLHTATRINKDGLIESVASDMPRLNYEINNGVVDSCPHLLLEMQSINLVTNSEVFNGFSKTNSTITDNSTTSPAGDVTGAILSDDSGGGSSVVEIYQTVSVSADKQHTMSVFAKKRGANFIALRAANFTSPADGQSFFNLNTGAVVSAATGHTAKIENYGNGWYRCSITFTTHSSDTTGTLVLRVSTNGTSTTVSRDGNSNIFIWGWQFEQANYATSYIPTSSGSSTRSTESCSGAGDVNTFNSVEGILYAELKRDVDEDNGFRRVNINDGSVANTVRLGYSTVTNEIKGVVTINTSTQISLVFPAPSVTSFRKMALLYKANKFELWVDGSKRAENTTTSVTFPANTLNDLSFQHSNGSDKLRAKVKDVRYYDTDGMSNTEITNLLTQLTQ
tara:strand:- start:302 stop:1579 length:1278 start_codon:yes stop_codon:yes gene_type:complete